MDKQTERSRKFKSVRSGPRSQKTHQFSRKAPSRNPKRKNRTRFWKKNKQYKGSKAPGAEYSAKKLELQKENCDLSPTDPDCVESDNKLLQSNMNQSNTPFTTTDFRSLNQARAIQIQRLTQKQARNFYYYPSLVRREASNLGREATLVRIKDPNLDREAILGQNRQILQHNIKTAQQMSTRSAIRTQAGQPSRLNLQTGSSTHNYRQVFMNPSSRPYKPVLCNPKYTNHTHQTKKEEPFQEFKLFGPNPRWSGISNVRSLFK